MKSNDKRLAEWQLTRERFHLANHYPPKTKRSARKIGDIIAEIQKKDQPTNSLPKMIEERWSIIAGAQIAQHTHPAHLKGTLLYVFADHPGWLAEIRRLPTKNLLKKIAAIPGVPEIKNIRFQLDPAVRTFRN